MKLARLADERLHAALEKLSKQTLPLKTAFKLKGIIKTVKAEFEKYEQVRLEALQNNGLKNEDGSLKVDELGNAQFDQAGLQSFALQINELVSLDIEMATLTVEELGDSINITAEDLEALEGIVTC